MLALHTFFIRAAKLLEVLYKDKAFADQNSVHTLKKTWTQQHGLGAIA